MPATPTSSPGGRTSGGARWRCASRRRCNCPPRSGRLRNCRTPAVERPAHDLSVTQSERGATLKVEQIRELPRTLSLLPYEAAYRVALLLRFQEANANAQNALLKTLEEAPTKVVLLLTANSAESLLPTIASRCEILRLRPLAVERLEGGAALAASWNPPRRVSGAVFRRAAGLRATPAGRPARVEQRGELLGDMLNLLAANRARRFKYAEELTKGERAREPVRQAFLLAVGLAGRAPGVRRPRLAAGQPRLRGRHPPPCRRGGTGTGAPCASWSAA